MKKTVFLAAAIAAAAFTFAPAQAAPLPSSGASVQGGTPVATTVAMHHRHHVMKKRHHMMMKRHHMRHHRRMMHHG